MTIKPPYLGGSKTQGQGQRVRRQPKSMLYVYPHEEISPTERDTRTREQAKNTFLQNSQPGVFDNPRNFPPQAPREKFLVNLEIGFFPTKQTKHGALPMFFLLIFVVLRLWHGAWVC